MRCWDELEFPHVLRASFQPSPSSCDVLGSFLMSELPWSSLAVVYEMKCWSTGGWLSSEKFQTSYFLNNVSIFTLIQNWCQNNGIGLSYIFSLPWKCAVVIHIFHRPCFKLHKLNSLLEVANRCCCLHPGEMLLSAPWCCKDGCLSKERAFLWFRFQHLFRLFWWPFQPALPNCQKEGLNQREKAAVAFSKIINIFETTDKVIRF